MKYPQIISYRIGYMLSTFVNNNFYNWALGERSRGGGGGHSISGMFRDFTIMMIMTNKEPWRCAFKYK